MYFAHSSGDICGSEHRQAPIVSSRTLARKLKKSRETVNMAIEITFNVFFGVHTPRTCLLLAVSVLLRNVPDRGRDLAEDLRGWRLGEYPLLPPMHFGTRKLKIRKSLGQVFRQCVLVPYPIETETDAVMSVYTLRLDCSHFCVGAWEVV